VPSRGGSSGREEEVHAGPLFDAAHHGARGSSGDPPWRVVELNAARYGAHAQSPCTPRGRKGGREGGGAGDGGGGAAPGKEEATGASEVEGERENGREGALVGG